MNKYEKKFYLRFQYMKSLINKDILNSRKINNWDIFTVLTLGKNFNAVNKRLVDASFLTEEDIDYFPIPYNIQNGNIGVDINGDYILPKNIQLPTFLYLFDFYIFNNIIYYSINEKRKKEALSNSMCVKYLQENFPELSISPKKTVEKTQAQTERAKLTPTLRTKILERDGYRCCMCGKSVRDNDDVRLEVDHRIPIAQGGLTTEDNLWTLCWSCNRGKSDKLLEGIDKI